MNIDLRALLDPLGIDYVTLDNGVIGTTISSDSEDAPEFSLAIFTWTGGDETQYLRLMITPFVTRPEDGYPVELADTVLILNDQMPKVKFAFDEDEDLALILDLDTDDFHQTKFQRAYELLGAYADYYFSQVASLVSH